jgi:16S rRNA (adenine1518-N6/adenine1519-N6)-dimethyltransferase
MQEDPASPSTVRDLLHQHGIRPRKRFGQHFLCDGNVLERIARLALPTSDQAVVEIGAGLGGLTLRLAARARKVVAVEIDRDLVAILQGMVHDQPNVETAVGDFLKLDTSELLRRAFGDDSGVVAGNIPYNITSPILERLLAFPDRIVRIVLVVQAELARRLAARPGSDDYSSLSVFAQYRSAVREEGIVPAHLFVPRPEVTSAIVTLEPFRTPPIMARDEAIFNAVVRAAFGYRRKTMANALARGGLLPDTHAAASLLTSVSIAPERRGESYAIEEFIQVADAIAARETA